MNKKSGTAGTAVEPIAPADPHEADKADPGEVDTIKAKQRQSQSGKYGSVKVNPFKPPPPGDAAASEGNDVANGAAAARSTPPEEQKKTSWIEIELVGEDDRPIPGEKYRIKLPDNSVDEGTLDDKGFARVEGFEKGDCQISFPELDREAWEDA
jgi:hypothetical protein